MPFQRESLQNLITRTSNDFVSRLSLAGSVLRRSVVYTLSRVIAGGFHELYGKLEFLSRQIFPDTSEEEYLQRQGAVYGITKNAATFASGNVVFTGSVNGTTIPAGTLLQRADGIRYATQADVSISSLTATVEVECLTAGSAGNALAGVVLTLVSPIISINNDSVVDSGQLLFGNDVESDESYRARVISRIKNPPQGGSALDYETWAKEVPGVTRAWAFPQELGLGTVTVRFVRDNDASIIPDAGEITQVADYIEARRPVTADVTVVAPVGDALNFTIGITPDTAAGRAAVEAELKDLLAQPEMVPGATIPLTQIRTAIGIANEITDYNLTSPAADVTNATGHIKIMGSITWL